MTREEAIKILSSWAKCKYKPTHDAAELAIAALRALQAPAKLDRSRWEGCEYCLEGKGVVTFAVPDEIEIPEDDVEMGWVEKPQYCPFCGRPLTEEAWAELEAKIGGNDGTADI